MNDGGTPQPKNIWLRAFYGFGPEEAGYIGFTHEADRETMFGRMRDGDLVLIYGAVDELTRSDLRRQALGFLEIRLARCTDNERASQSSIDWKRSNGFEDRWTYGIEVQRAWRIDNRVHIKTIAPEAYRNENRFERTTKAILLTPQERERALSHTVRQVNVYREDPVVSENLGAGAMSNLLKPSRGIPPKFGARGTMLEDGENCLYLMIFSQSAEFVLGQGGQHAGHALAKVGRSNEPSRRLRELNGGLPSNAIFGWRLVQTLKLPDGATAHALEDELKALLAAKIRSEGGEFYSGDENIIRRLFHEFCCAHTHKILGAPGRAAGVKR